MISLLHKSLDGIIFNAIASVTAEIDYFPKDCPIQDFSNLWIQISILIS